MGAEAGVARPVRGRNGVGHFAQRVRPGRVAARPTLTPVARARKMRPSYIGSIAGKARRSFVQPSTPRAILPTSSTYLAPVPHIAEPVAAIRLARAFGLLA